MLADAKFVRAHFEPRAVTPVYINLRKGWLSRRLASNCLLVFVGLNDESLDKRMAVLAEPKLLGFDPRVGIFPGLTEATLKAVRAVGSFE
jgi:hypothetical protein